MIYTFIVLALAEEIVKFLTFRKVLKDSDYPFSWLDLTITMVVVSIGFGGGFSGVGRRAVAAQRR